MLGEGIRAAFRFLGHDYRTVCYVEREAAAAGQLAALMEAGIIDQAPVWSDMLTFDGAAWRGRVDCVIAGFPCQDLSIAGRRAGLDGKRSGLFFRVCDIADDCQARILILENVSAIASATASVVDEAEGELEERAAARVMGELADRGWDAEWITLSASDVGASHRRARWFCFAWRMADAERTKRRPQRAARDRGQQGHDGSRQAHGGAGVAEQALADTRRSAPRRQQHEPWASRKPSEYQLGREAVGYAGLQHQQLREREIRPEHPPTSGIVDDATSPRCNGARKRPEADSNSGKCVSGERRENVGNAERSRRAQAGSRSGINTGRESESGCRDMANTISPRLQERTGGGSNDESLQQTERADAISVCDALGIFAPGPDSADWPAIIDRYPFLAPAAEPCICGVVDGNPLVVDESRSHQLRAIGNGVVPAQAGCALVVLMRRAGIRIK